MKIQLAIEWFLNPDSYAKERPILEFFREIGITDLDTKAFQSAFLG